MGIIGRAKKVKLFCAILDGGESVKEKAFAELEKKLGKIDFTSEIINFEDFTSYYNAEMGVGIKRFWISFENLISPEDLAEIKVFTNSLEDELSVNNKRRVNIDPGYVSAANVILASTKDFSHRIYLGKGIYAEVTTIYKKEGFIKLPWSYPDYMSQTASDFLMKIRTSLMKRLKEISSQAI
ncbi:MAG: DUF4416 family protein [Endomicrobium sp.]|jgi:hypothetical protein|nr:DUF4416 family protein [Endomicrobium sp.]